MDCSYITPLMSKNSIKNVLENLFLMFGRGKTQNRAKTHRPSMSAFSAIFVLKENGTQSHSAKFLNWGDHVNSVPDLGVSPPDVMYQKTQFTDIGNNLNIEDEEFDSLVKVELILHIFLYWS